MATKETPPARSYERFYRTLRLTFAYEGSAVRLVSRMSVEMLLPKPNAVPIREGQSGFWYELRDNRDRVLYQRAVHNPIRFDVEIFPEDQKEPIRRRALANPRGTFDLLVPDVPEGDSVVLFSSPSEPERSTGPAHELGRFSLKHE
jgi:hypothetical protein